MKIGVISPVWFSVPPSNYGGIELVVSLEVENLVELGHDVTLFASGGSQTKARLISPLAEPPDPTELGKPWFNSYWEDAYHATVAYDYANEFDVIHDHTYILGPVLGRAIERPPVVHTLHERAYEGNQRLYEYLSDGIHTVAISETQCRAFKNLECIAVVPNGIDPEQYPMSNVKDDYALFIGRCNPDKGPMQAIETAHAAGLPIKMVLRRTEAREIQYWETELAPRLGADDEVLEGISHAEKVQLLQKARVLLFPIHWEEPFGLVMIEAMACGTPVVTSSRGAAPEIVVDGETGFIRDDLNGWIEATQQVLAGAISSEQCRQRVLDKFSAEAMAQGYVRVFEQVTSSNP